MSWDWDKLQENRKRQRGGGNPRNESPEDHSEESREEFQRERKKFSSPNHGNGGEDPFGHFLKKWPLGRSAMVVFLLFVFLWLLSGIYIVNPDEQGVVLRFGRYDRTVDSGHSVQNVKQRLAHQG